MQLYALLDTTGFRGDTPKDTLECLHAKFTAWHDEKQYQYRMKDVRIVSVSHSIIPTSGNWFGTMYAVLEVTDK